MELNNTLAKRNIANTVLPVLNRFGLEKAPSKRFLYYMYRDTDHPAREGFDEPSFRDQYFKVVISNTPPEEYEVVLRNFNAHSCKAGDGPSWKVAFVHDAPSAIKDLWSLPSESEIAFLNFCVSSKHVARFEINNLLGNLKSSSTSEVTSDFLSFVCIAVMKHYEGATHVRTPATSNERGAPHILAKKLGFPQEGDAAKPIDEWLEGLTQLLTGTAKKVTDIVLSRRPENLPILTQ